jgi:hypothetical protein
MQGTTRYQEEWPAPLRERFPLSTPLDEREGAHRPNEGAKGREGIKEE